MKSIMLIIVSLFLLFSINTYAEEPFDCSKYEDFIWEGTITNPTKLLLRIKVYNNERINGDKLIGLPPPYFNVLLKPGETAQIEYQCGENSIIFVDEKIKSFRSLDFHVPNTFLNGKSKLFKYELMMKKTKI